MTTTTTHTGEIPTVPFGRILRHRMRGNDVHGVRRALARAGHGELGELTTVFSADAVKKLRAFQNHHGLTVDGVYGPRSHSRLKAYFDDYAFLLYTGKPPRPPMPTLQLPSVFTPTHQTAGLDGYPAIDVFAKAATSVLAPAAGKVRRLSGHDPREGGVPGGAYGWSVYLATDLGDYFITHLGTRTVKEGQQVKRSEPVGTVCDAAVAHMPTSLSHIHLGFHAEDL